MSVARATARRSGLARLQFWNVGWAWRAYTFLFGAVGPLTCFTVAIVQGFFGNWTLPLAAYAVVCAASSAIWIAPGTRGPALTTLVGGVFLGATLVTILFLYPWGVFGVCMLGKGLVESDWSLVGYGWLGVQPLLALPAFALNAKRAFLPASAHERVRLLRTLTLVGSLAIPLASHSAIEAAAVACEKRVLTSESELDRPALSRLRWLTHGRTWTVLLDEYWSLTQKLQAPPNARAKRVADAYELLTGLDIVTQLEQSTD